MSRLLIWNSMIARKQTMINVQIQSRPVEKLESTLFKKTATVSMDQLFKELFISKITDEVDSGIVNQSNFDLSINSISNDLSIPVIDDGQNKNVPENEPEDSKPISLWSVDSSFSDNQIPKKKVRSYSEVASTISDVHQVSKNFSYSSSEVDQLVFDSGTSSRPSSSKNGEYAPPKNANNSCKEQLVRFHCAPQTMIRLIKEKRITTADLLYQTKPKSVKNRSAQSEQSSVLTGRRGPRGGRKERARREKRLRQEKENIERATKTGQTNQMFSKLKAVLKQSGIETDQLVHQPTTSKNTNSTMKKEEVESKTGKNRRRNRNTKKVASTEDDGFTLVTKKGAAVEQKPSSLTPTQKRRQRRQKAKLAKANQLQEDSTLNRQEVKSNSGRKHRGGRNRRRNRMTKVDASTEYDGFALIAKKGGDTVKSESQKRRERRKRAEVRKKLADAN